MSPGGKQQELREGLLDSGHHGTSVLLTVATAVKTVLGSGLLTLSWSFYLSTMWPGIAVMILMCVLAAHSFFNLGLCAEITGQKTYGQIWCSLYGKSLAWLPDMVTLVYCSLSAVSYWIVVGDFLPRGAEGLGLDSAWLLDRRCAILLVGLVLLPLNFLHDLSFLGYTSLIGTIGILYTVAVVCSEAASSPPGDWEASRLRFGIFTTIPVVTFSFNGHFAAPSLYRGLASRSSSRWMVVSVLSGAVCCALNLACAVAGYSMLGSQLGAAGHSNVLTAPALQGKVEVLVADLTIMMAIALGVPIYIKAARDSADAIWVRNGAEWPEHRRSTLLSAVLSAGTLWAATLLSDLGVMCAVNGAVCASLLMFVFPAVMYLKCGSSPWNRRMSTASAIFGSLVGALGAVSSIATALQD